MKEAFLWVGQRISLALLSSLRTANKLGGGGKKNTLGTQNVFVVKGRSSQIYSSVRKRHKGKPEQVNGDYCYCIFLKPTALRMPKRSPIQVLAGLNVA